MEKRKEKKRMKIQRSGKCHVLRRFLMKVKLRGSIYSLAIKPNRQTYQLTWIDTYVQWGIFDKKCTPSGK
jgi:hypothetical protein